MEHNLDSPEMTEYLNSFREEVLPNLKESMFVVAIAPRDGNADLKIAIEVGCAILLDKPLIIFKTKDSWISPRLATIADKIIEGDMSTEGDRMRRELTEFIEETRSETNH